MADIPPVDRSQRILSNGQPVPEDNSHRNIRQDGQQEGYIILTAEERHKGYVRPVRQYYRHVGTPEHPGCNQTTKMALSIAETFARDPDFYQGGFCCSCRKHFPNEELVWEGTNQRVGT